MKISYNWLKTFVKIDYSPSETAALLTDLGLEVEGITTFESIKGGLKGLVVGKVMAVTPHPNADKLQCTRVRIGTDTELQIVCGAPNVAEGQTVVVAPPGTHLYDESGKSFEIGKRKLRGQPSEGMICAEDEIGLGSGHDGIMVLDAAQRAGTPLSEIFDVTVDSSFEIGLTPNRADAMSHWGVARDLNARFLLDGLRTQVCTPSVKSYAQDCDKLPIHIEVEDATRAPRYAGVTLCDVKVKASPAWLQNHLKAIGLTPINNVVDVTNYVSHALGQPLHAFDYKAISGRTLRVKTPDKETELRTLDGVERKLSTEDLSICDAEKPLCIAGVLGGLHSGVTAQTTELFLESAYFDPVAIRKTAKRHGLHTDASFRFERGIDPNSTIYALKYAALLLKATAGAQIASPIHDHYPNPIPQHAVTIDLERIDRLIGQHIPLETVVQILEALEIEILSQTPKQLALQVPAYRVDVTREADIAEEILRVYGYNRIAMPDKLHSTPAHQKGDALPLQNRIAEQLAARGFQEIMTVSLSNAHYNAHCETLPETALVPVLNPLSQELDSMRQTLLFGALETVSRNIKHQNHRLKLFELGKVYERHEGTFVEERRVCLALCGERNPESWYLESSPTDFFYLKGHIEVLFKKLGIEGLKYKCSKDDRFSEGLQLFAGGQSLGDMGSVRQSLCEAFDIKTAVFAAELDFEALLELSGRNAVRFQPLPRYPAVRRDLALLLPDETEFSEVEEIAYQTERKRLKAVELFDVYRGEKLPKGKKSYAVRFLLQDEGGTLTDEQTDKIMRRLLKRYQQVLNATLR